MHREYLRLAKNLHKVCVNMSSRQSGIYTPKLNISDDKTIQELTKDIDRMIMFLNKPQYSYMSKNKK